MMIAWSQPRSRTKYDTSTDSWTIAYSTSTATGDNYEEDIYYVEAVGDTGPDSDQAEDGEGEPDTPPLMTVWSPQKRDAFSQVGSAREERLHSVRARPLTARCRSPP